MPTKNPLVEEKPYASKTALIIGMARSGQAAAKLVHAAGGRVLLYDRKKKEEFEDLSMLAGLEGINWHLGEDINPLYREADFSVISPGIPPTAPDIRGAVEAGLPVYGELELASTLIPCPMYAVTGTNGKTTTVSLLGDMLIKGGFLTHVTGNIGYPLSASALLATPDDRIVVEVSSFQLETAITFHPTAAAVLNITPDHLDRHGSMEAYVALKKRVFQNMTAQDTAVLNQDDALCAGMAEGIQAQVLWFSRKNEVSQGTFLREGQIVLRASGAEKIICPVEEIKIPGQHNVENALAAVALASVAGIPAPVIRHSLRTFPGVEHRIEYVREVNKVWYINDSKGTNPDSTQKAVEAMQVPTVLILGGRDKKTSFEALAETIRFSPNIHHIVLMGEAADVLEKALRGKDIDSISLASSLEDAIYQAKEKAARNGAVLFSPACASFDMFNNYEERGRCFKAIVQAL